MDIKLENEILRLVKEIREDESSLVIAERLDDERKIGRLKDSINRKLELIKLLKA